MNMKKMFSLLLALFILMLVNTDTLAETAEASPQIPYAQENFVIRNGITWEMSPAEVMAIEPDEWVYLDELTDHFSRLSYYEVPLSRFTADFTVFFANEKLFFCHYRIYAADDIVSRSYFINALSSKYGYPERTEFTVIGQFINNIYNIDNGRMDYWSDGNISSSLYDPDPMVWITDDTTVCLFTVNHTSYLLYVCNNFDWSEPEYDMFGL